MRAAEDFCPADHILAALLANAAEGQGWLWGGPVRSSPLLGSLLDWARAAAQSAAGSLPPLQE